MKKVLLVSFEFPPHPGGIGSYGYSLATALSEKFEVVVLCLNHSPEKSKLFDSQERPFKIVRFEPAGNKLFDVLKRYKTVLNIIKQEKPDVAIANNDSSLVLLGLPLLLRKIKKTLVVGHGLEFVMLDRPIGKVYKWLLGKVNLVVPNSEYTKSLVVKNAQVSEERVKLVFPCADEDTYYPENTNMDNFFNIVTVGRVGPRKNHSLTIKAIAGLPIEIRNNVHYHIVGRGPNGPMLKELAENLGVADQVTQHGFVENEEIRSLLNSADLFTMPSVNADKPQAGDIEGFGIVLVEANFCKTPVVGSYGNGTESAIKEGVNGFVIDFKDDKALSNIIRKLYVDNELLTKLKESSYRFAMQNYTKKIFSQKWVSIINEL